MKKLWEYIYDYSLAFIASILLVVLTLFIFYQTKADAKERRNQLFELKTVMAVSKVKSKMQDYIQILRGVKGLIMIQDTLTREEWKHYFNLLSLEENYPGIQGFGYAVYTHKNAVDAMTKQLKGDNSHFYGIQPITKDSILTPIVYIEPFDWRNKRALGFNMFSDPVRKKAMELARDQAKPILSGKVTLVQETEKNIQSGFLLFVPVYKNVINPKELDARRALIKSYVYSAFRAIKLFDAIFGNEYKNINIHIYAGNFSEISLLYGKKDSHVEEESTGLVKISSIQIAGETWFMTFAADKTFGSFSERRQPYILLVGGLIISILSFFLFWFFANVKKGNKLLETVTSNATAALFMLNENGRCTFMNAAAERMTGYEFDEVVGQPFKAISGKDKEIGDDLSSKMNTKNREDFFVRKDGSAFPVILTVQKVHENHFQEFTVVEVRDISDEKKSAERIQAINENLRMKNEALERSNNDLDNFVYTASHDLKAPVSNIEGLIYTLEDILPDGKLLGEYKPVLEMIKRSIRQFKNTIQELSDITKVQKNLELDSEKIHIVEVMEEVKESISSLIKESGAIIEEHIEKEHLVFSRSSFKSIVYNLLSNALKYRNPARIPIIKIAVYDEGRYTLLTVEDNGLGIKEEQLNKVFLMYKRLHSHVEGSGIGLYIVKRMVENEGGKIEVSSKEGVGTKFTVFFPKNKEDTFL